MWMLDDALALVRQMQPLMRPLDFHVAIGGGVVNRGASENDLDLYVLPVFKGRPYQWTAVDQVLEEMLGFPQDLIHTSEGPTGREGPTYRSQRRYRLKVGELIKVVDVFIADPERKQG